MERAEVAGSTHHQPQTFALINEVVRSQLNDKLLLKWVQGSGVFEFVGCLGRRVEFKDAIAKRQAVWEYAPDSNGAKEALAVCEALDRRAK